ncbi:MAG TPA: MBL fold metallo-hydrolase, partial [Bacillota bacterium]|nr:MBL fold metallo-hydrolase [Bacillota bacterium]
MTDSRDCCVYLVDGGGELALIDAGLGYSYRQILNNIKEIGLDVSRLKCVVATHGHIDHIGGLHRFQPRGAKVVCHELEEGAVARGIPGL